MNEQAQKIFKLSEVVTRAVVDHKIPRAQGEAAARLLLFAGELEWNPEMNFRDILRRTMDVVDFYRTAPEKSAMVDIFHDGEDIMVTIGNLEDLYLAAEKEANEEEAAELRLIRILLKAAFWMLGGRRKDVLYRQILNQVAKIRDIKEKVRC